MSLVKPKDRKFEPAMPKPFLLSGRIEPSVQEPKRWSPSSELQNGKNALGKKLRTDSPPQHW